MSIIVSENQENNKHHNVAIIYIDGSAMPNPGYYGSGIHGYVYNTETIDKSDKNKPNKYNITDIGYVAVSDLSKKYKEVKPHLYVNGYVSFKNIGTNNIAEVEAFIYAVDAVLKQNYDKGTNIDKIIFKTDSMYLINIVKNIRNGCSIVDKPDTPNPGLWKRIETLLPHTEEVGLKIVIEKVKGHSYNKEKGIGDIGNHISDRLALIGRYESTMGNYNTTIIFTDSTRYWNPDTARHPFLFGRQLFFTNSTRSKQTESTYGILNYKTDVEPGRKTSDAGFGIVKLSNPDSIIEDSIDEFNRRLGTLSIISTLDLSELYTQQSLTMYKLFKNAIYTFKKKHNLLEIMEESRVAYSIKPAGLATNAFEKLMILEQIIQDYKSNESIKDRYFLDITDRVYKPNDKGKNTCTLVMSDKILNLDVDINGVKLMIPLELGKETLGRNQFKKVEKLKPKVILTVDKISDIYYEYYTIIHLEETDDIACYVNFYSNGVYLKKDKK